MSSPVTEALEATEDPRAPFDLEAASVGDLLDTPPPPREWLVQDRIPFNVVGLLAAAGGTGKSFATLQLAVAVATGGAWLGHPVGRDGCVLIISAEDDRAEIHRRLHSVLDRLRADGDLTPEQENRIRDRLYVLDRVGENNLLTAEVDREVVRTAMADKIAATAQQMPGPALIVLDPLARFDGGDPNDNAEATRLIEAAEAIRRGSGATVLLPHHVAKASAGNAEAGQEAVRGASGLVDGARWVGLMRGMTPKEANDYGLTEEESGRFLRLTVPKCNGAPPTAGQWLQRLEGGVLAPTELKATKKQAREAKADEQYQKVLKETKRLIRKHGPMSARHIRTQYGGTAGILGVGDKAVRAALNRAVEEGEFFEHPLDGNRGNALHFAPGDE